MSRARKLRALLAEPGILVLPGAADALTARLIEDAGFPAVHAPGAGIASALLGLPDLGLTTMTEVVEQVRRLASWEERQRLVRLPAFGALEHRFVTAEGKEEP